MLSHVCVAFSCNLLTGLTSVLSFQLNFFQSVSALMSAMVCVVFFLLNEIAFNLFVHRSLTLKPFEQLLRVLDDLICR